MKAFKMMLMGAIALTAVACAEGREGETTGTLVGAGLGALLGSQVGEKGGTGRLVAVAVGTLAGAYVGRELGRDLDERDRQRMQQTTQNALETNRSGQTSSWHNPDSGNRGTITPQPAFSTNQYQYCREYEQTVTIDGEQVKGIGTACRQEDGTWVVVSNQ